MIPQVSDPAYKWVDRFSSISDRFINKPIPDPDLPIIRENWVKGIAKNIRAQAHLSDWVRIAHSTNLPLGISWLDMDEFWQTAVAEEVNDLIKEQNKASNDSMSQMQSKIDTIQPYRSPMDSMPKPSFFGAK